MNTSSLTLLWVQVSARLTKRSACIAVLFLLTMVLLSPGIVSAYSGMGGYDDEKLLGDGAAQDASFYLGDAPPGPVVLGYGVTVPSTSDRGIAYYLMEILLVVIALGMFIIILKLTGNPIVALISTIVGLMAVIIIRAILDASF